MVVVVTHDRLMHLQVTLTQLSDTALPVLHAVVVVDNASDDGTAQWLADQDDPRLVVHRCETNGGGAGGRADVAHARVQAWANLISD